MRRNLKSDGTDVAFVGLRQRLSVAAGITRWPAGPRTYVRRVVALPLTIQHCQSGFGTSEARFFCAAGQHSAYSRSSDWGDWPLRSGLAQRERIHLKAHVFGQSIPGNKSLTLFSPAPC